MWLYAAATDSRHEPNMKHDRIHCTVAVHSISLASAGADLASINRKPCHTRCGTSSRFTYSYHQQCLRQLTRQRLECSAFPVMCRRAWTACQKTIRQSDLSTALISALHDTR